MHSSRRRRKGDKIRKIHDDKRITVLFLSLHHYFKSDIWGYRRETGNVASYMRAFGLNGQSFAKNQRIHDTRDMGAQRIGADCVCHLILSSSLSKKRRSKWCKLRRLRSAFSFYFPSLTCSSSPLPIHRISSWLNVAPCSFLQRFFLSKKQRRKRRSWED